VEATMKWYKIVFCGGIFLSILWLYHKTTEAVAPLKQAEPHQYNPANTIVAFDIHEVITKKQIWPMLKTAYNYPQKWKMLRSCSLSMLRKTLSCLWNREWNRMRKLFHDENQYLFEFMHQIADTQEPVEETVNIIQQLKATGYELHILSNISESAYASFKEKFSGIFSLFDVEQLSMWDEDTIVEKPHAEYFRRYLSAHNTNNKQVLFIDDQQKNIDAAEQHEIIGIRFKSAGQLKEDLHRLKLLE